MCNYRMCISTVTHKHTYNTVSVQLEHAYRMAKTHGMP